MPLARVYSLPAATQPRGWAIPLTCRVSGIWGLSCIHPTPCATGELVRRVRVRTIDPLPPVAFSSAIDESRPGRPHTTGGIQGGRLASFVGFHRVVRGRFRISSARFAPRSHRMNGHEVSASRIVAYRLPRSECRRRLIHQRDRQLHLTPAPVTGEHRSRRRQRSMPGWRSRRADQPTARPERGTFLRQQRHLRVLCRSRAPDPYRLRARAESLRCRCCESPRHEAPERSFEHCRLDRFNTTSIVVVLFGIFEHGQSAAAQRRLHPRSLTLLETQLRTLVYWRQRPQPTSKC